MRSCVLAFGAAFCVLLATTTAGAGKFEIPAMPSASAKLPTFVMVEGLRSGMTFSEVADIMVKHGYQETLHGITLHERHHMFCRKRQCGSYQGEDKYLAVARFGKENATSKEDVAISFAPPYSGGGAFKIVHTTIYALKDGRTSDIPSKQDVFTRHNVLYGGQTRAWDWPDSNEYYACWHYQDGKFVGFDKVPRISGEACPDWTDAEYGKYPVDGWFSVNGKNAKVGDGGLIRETLFDEALYDGMTKNDKVLESQMK